jgi:hypothetical protein
MKKKLGAKLENKKLRKWLKKSYWKNEDQN